MEAALDTVPHANVLATLQKWGTNKYIQRYLYTWLTGRRLMLRLQSPCGAFVSPHRFITRGLPQGGVLSPFLWLIHFADVGNQLKRRRAQRMDPRGKEPPQLCDLFYADDVVLAIAHTRRERPTQETWKESRVCKKALGKKGLAPTQEESANFLLSPREAIGGFFRRRPNAHRASEMELKKKDLDLQVVVGSSGDEEGDDAEIEKKKLLYLRVARMETGGVIFDQTFGFLEHIASIIARSRVRQHILERIGGRTWGEETNILSTTHKAPIESVIEYGFIAVGSGAYEYDMRKLDTCVLNPSARAITGVSFSACLITLHAAAGAKSIRNIYIQDCACFLGRAQRAHNSGVRDRLQSWRAAQYQVGRWNSEVPPFVPTPPLPEGVYQRGQRDYQIRETWRVALLSQMPTPRRSYAVPNIYYSTAEEVEENPQLKDRTYDFRGAGNWRDVAMQALLRVGWRPDCAVAQEIIILKVLPPRDPSTRLA